MDSCTGNQAFTLIGFPHSDIPGSMDICSSPRLFAAYRVLRRLSVPRHSPCALSNLTYYRFSSFNVDILTLQMKFDLKTCVLCTSYCVRDCKIFFTVSFSRFREKTRLSFFSLSLSSVYFSSLCSCQGANGLLLTRELVETTRFELVTSCLQGRRSPN